MSILDGRVAIVTGASSGIGRAIALTFAQAGAIVVIADVTDEALEGGAPTAALVAEAGGRAAFQRTDVSRWADVDALVSETVARRGRLDIMVNNAAIYSGTGLVETSEEQWAQVMGVNMTGLYHGCKRAVQQMLTQEPLGEARGRIVNLGSQMGIVTAPRDTAYGVSKAGAIYITRQIAVDYAKDLDRLQFDLARQDRDRQAGAGDASGPARQRPPPHPLAPPRAPAGRRQRRAVPGERSGELHHGRQPRGRWRLARGVRRPLPFSREREKVPERSEGG